ncbi:beta-ketoacyl-[acyl-carrier-protein] synthase family protein [Noviherbaspirillum sp.]|uniref:beta-ketoacyl-[acyl-carrier-protein] synthase family protein n=1 Tax=Noviherbaspirillum sp. TaxID=1926288 RepID=UPI002FE28766
MRRVAVTGIGIVSPLGDTITQLEDNLVAGRSAIGRLDDEAFGRLTTRIAAQTAFDGVRHFDPPKLRMLDRVSQLALVAARKALEDAAFEPDFDRSRAGVFIGTGMGGSLTTDDGYRTLYEQQSDRIKPFSVLLAMNNAAASWIGLEYGITGPNLTYSTACSSSAVAIGEAAKAIRAGDADVMIAGGAEAPLSLGTMKAWEALRTLAVEDTDDPAASCRPFSKNRTGLVLAEGAAIVILEEWERAVARGAVIYAELAGYGLATDIAHLTRPSVEGQARAMDLALASARIDAADIAYLNAHGTGTPANDPVETAAIRQVFGAYADRLAVSSSKSMHGHLLGAAGALEFVIAILAMRSGVMPPTINLDQPDPECDLDYVANAARHGQRIGAVMSNSFAFGGTNAVLVAKAA